MKTNLTITRNPDDPLIRFSIILILLTFVSCHSPQDTQPVNIDIPLKPLIIKNEPGSGYGADIRLSIRRTVVTDTSTVYYLESEYENKPVGLMISLPLFRKGKKEAHLVIFESAGTPSDRLLHLLADLYQQPMDSNARFTASVSAAIINLDDYNSGMQDSTGNRYTAPYQYKLFFDAENVEGDDAEMFLDIDPANAWADLGEKEQDYRPKLIRMFKEH